MRHLLLLALASAAYAGPTRADIESIRMLGPLPSEYVTMSFAAAARSPDVAHDSRVVFHAVLMDNGRILSSRQLGTLDSLGNVPASFSAQEQDVTCSVSFVPADSTRSATLRYYISVSDTLSPGTPHFGRIVAQSHGAGSLPDPGESRVLCQGVLRQGTRETLRRPHQLQPVLLVVATGGFITPEVDGAKPAEGATAP